MEEGRTGTKPELSKVMADVTSMKGRQDSLDSQLSAMKRENEVLWREVAILREKHRKQQHIVNKLIQFLVTLVQSSRNGGLGIKRHYPLMLNDTSHRSSKISKPSSEFSNLNSTTHTLSPTGPVIHELDTAELFEDCEALPGETSVKEAFLPTEFCNVVINDAEQLEHQGSTLNLKPNEPPPGSPDSIASNPNTEVLLELAEECPLSPSLLLTASPMDVNPVVGTPKLYKGKDRKGESLSDSKKRRSKSCNSNAKTFVSAASATPNTSPKVLYAAAEEGVDLLDMVLPTTYGLKTHTNNEAANHVEVNEDLLTPNSVAAATVAAISGINMTAANKNKSFKLTDSLGMKRISISPLDGILPMSSVTSNKCASANLADSAVSESDASSNAKPKTSDLMIFKQEPSTSSDQSGSSSNMILARTGINSEENCFDRIELDSHVDSVQHELDTLRELLRGQEYSLDYNTLLGVCDTCHDKGFLKLFGEDPLPATAFENLLEDRDKQNTGGSELATYTPNLLDMVDMFGNSDAGEWSSPSTPESSSVMDVTLCELNTPQTTVPSPIAKKIE